MSKLNKPFFYAKIIKKDSTRGDIRITAQREDSFIKQGQVIITASREILAIRWTGNWKTFKDTSTFTNQQNLIYQGLLWATMSHMIIGLNKFFDYNKIKKSDSTPFGYHVDD